MFLTDFFIKRPVLATVINLLILVTGLLAFSKLGLREYPKVSSPVFSIQVNYPNASAEVIELEVATPLEDALGGLEGVESISSKSRYGHLEVNLQFKAGTDLSKAQAGIRDRLAMSRGQLPMDVKEPIVQQQESDAEPFLYLSLTSDQASFAELTHIANIYLKNPLKTIEGVSNVNVMGQPYSMVIKLNEAKLLQYHLDPSKVYDVLSKYNVSLPGGRYQEAIPITIDLTASSVKDFAKIPVIHHKDAIVFLKDVADIELQYDRTSITRVDGKPGVLLGVVKSTDGNPLEISNEVNRRLDEFNQILPRHVKLLLTFDKTKFIRGSLESVEKAIIEAIILVILIVFLFLRNFRSILIPVIAIPLSLIGVLSLMSLFGLSINTITLLAMVLAVGLVVDDAIVVLENIHRHIEKGMQPKEAALQGAREIGFAIIAMTFTLASVYAPIAFIQDTIGQVFFEFALTLAGAVVISGIVALTFSPLMCSLLLKSHGKHYLPSLDIWLSKLEQGYQRWLKQVFEWPRAMLVALSACIVICLGLFYTIPPALTPLEDRGIIGVFIPPLAGSSLDEFDHYIRQVEKIMTTIEEAPGYLTFAGDWGAYIVTALKPWDERKRSAAELVEVLRKQIEKIPTAQAHPWSWDTGIPGVEQVSAQGASLSLYVQTVGDYKHLNKYIEELKKSITEDSHFTDAYHDLKLDTPAYSATIDRRKLALSGVRPEQISLNLGIMMDQNTWLEFKKDGVRYPITLTSEEKPFFLEEVFAINDKDKLVPFSSFMSIELDALPRELNHYNQLRSAQLNMSLPPGTTLAKGVELTLQKAENILPSDLRYEFAGAAKKMQESSAMMVLLILVALLFIYCILAIQFESFADPLIIMFTVPLAGFGALGLVWLTGGSLDIYTQVGLVTLIGLISKHGILIVEFANQQLDHGEKLIDAVSNAAKLRLRPILMTTGAMVFGALPLVLATGAGAEARHAIGLVLVGGLSVGTCLTLFVIPGVYKMVKSWEGR